MVSKSRYCTKFACKRNHCMPIIPQMKKSHCTFDTAKSLQTRNSFTDNNNNNIPACLPRVFAHRDITHQRCRWRHKALIGNCRSNIIYGNKTGGWYKLFRILCYFHIFSHAIHGSAVCNIIKSVHYEIYGGLMDLEKDARHRKRLTPCLA